MRKFTCFSIYCCVLTASLMGQSAKRTVYRNKDYQFCVSLPRGWVGGESFTKNGITLTPTNANRYKRAPQITVGARINQPSEQNDERPQTLKEDVDSIIPALREYDAAENVQIIKEIDTTIQMVPARSIALQYRNSRTGEDWSIKHTELIDRKEIVYFIELTCDPKDAEALSVICEGVVKSLRIHCEGRGAAK